MLPTCRRCPAFAVAFRFQMYECGVSEDLVGLTRSCARSLRLVKVGWIDDVERKYMRDLTSSASGVSLFVHNSSILPYLSKAKSHKPAVQLKYLSRDSQVSWAHFS